LDRRHQESNQHSDDGDDDKQFDKGKRASHGQGPGSQERKFVLQKVDGSYQKYKVALLNSRTKFREVCKSSRQPFEQYRYNGEELLCRRASWKLVSGARFDIILGVESGPGQVTDSVLQRGSAGS
jgi:hypothetical protein